MRGHVYFFLAMVLLSAGCAKRFSSPFVQRMVPPAPDYSQSQSWAALPWTDDAADNCPDGLEDRQSEAPADVFYIHPTTYTGRTADGRWNGDVQDVQLRQKTSERPIRFQASIFNAAGRVFAPFYRQAHLQAYFTEDTVSARRAFALAYEDVARSFEYYLEHYNEGRPIIIAAHSQGATHGQRLLKNFFDGKPLQQQLIAAYLVGMPIRRTAFEVLQPCVDEQQTGCYVSWRTFRKGAAPRQQDTTVVVVNPLTWTMGDTLAPASANRGAVLRPFEKVRPGNVSAQVHGPVLWSSKPSFPGSFLLRRKNYHIGDYNLFYLDVRENAVVRSRAFFQRR